MPWPSAPSVTAASPVRTPARSREAGRTDLLAERRDGRDEVEAGADGPLGVVLVRDRRAPDGHHRVADELLDGAAVALDDAPRVLEVAGEELPHLLGVAGLREGREADEVGEEHRDEPPLGLRRRRAGRPGAAPRRAAAPHSPQNFAPGVFAAPQPGQASASFAPHSPQNFRPASFSVPHAGHLIRGE